MRGIRNRLISVAAAAVTLTGFFGIGAPPAAAEAIISAYDVAGTVQAPVASTGAFTALGKLANTGLLPQGAGATLTFSVVGGTITATGPGCAGAVCTAGALDSGASQGFTATVQPAANATSVVVKVDVLPAPPLIELNVLPDSANNHAESTTTIPYGVDVSIVNDPPAVLAGEPTRLDVTATNLLAPQSMTMVLQTGGTLNPNFPVPAGCSGAGNPVVVTCTTTAATVKWPISVKGTTPFTSVATLTGSVAGQDAASVTTTNNPDAFSFVGEGDCVERYLAFVGAKLCAQIGSTSGGAVVAEGIHQVDASAKLCGAVNCANAAPEILVRKTGDYVAGSNLSKPLTIDARYEPKHGPPITCAGGGSGAQCYSDALYYYFNVGDTPIKMNKCAVPGKLSNINEVCWDTVTKLSGGAIVVRVNFLRDLVLPIIGSAAKG